MTTLKQWLNKWLIAEWQHAWKMVSLWSIALGSLAMAISNGLADSWSFMPESLKAYMSGGEGHRVAQYILWAGFVGRFIRQRHPPEGKP